MARRSKLGKCSFCGRDPHQVSKLLAGPSVFICEQCVGLCNQILAADGTPPATTLGDLSDEDLLGTLAATAAAAASLHGLLRDRVDELRSRQVSWASIGAALGVSRQAAWERFS